MLLNEFITETLTSIINGIIETQKKVSETGAEVVPNKRRGYGHIEDHVDNIHNVDFEIELAETISQEGKWGIGVSFGATNIGVKRKKRGTDASNTRIKFSIPIIYPITKEE